MTLAFITNFINHHQIHLADEFYKILGDGYKFIATEPIPDSFIKTGYPIYDRDYLVNAYESTSELERAITIANDSDVVIIGSAPEIFVEKRIGENKLTFRYNERWFKSRPWFLTGPRGWINFWKNHIKHRNKPLYMLCASAFTAKDVNTIGAYKNKCFKWGYFTKVDELDLDELNERHKASERSVRIMWCARFIDFKHPEMPIKLAARLKVKGYKFVINMYGGGEELDRTIRLAKSLNVDDCVNFIGNRPNNQILEAMRKHDIFLFTSDRNEGWGAVLNEAMSCGCAVVASHKIGAVPFLIDDGINGLVFKSGNLDSLEVKVIELIECAEKRKELSRNAHKTITEVWSPENAAHQFLNLVKAIVNNDVYQIPQNGPCSLIESI